MISTFDIFSIGIGPSSSHTVGPMRASKKFIDNLIKADKLSLVTSLSVELFGSLGQTGKGHGSGKAVILGLAGYEPETIDLAVIEQLLSDIEQNQQIPLNQQYMASFPRKNAIVFHRRKTLPGHSNAMTLHAYNGEQLLVSETYYSIGGGFIINADDFEALQSAKKEEVKGLVVPYPFDSAEQLLAICTEKGFSISTLMLENEKKLADEAVIKSKLMHIFNTMRESVANGIKHEGILPGGLKVKRRAPALHLRLSIEQTTDPLVVMDWVNLFALAVNEENAAGGRVVTAPTNGAAGIIPAVMLYYDKYIHPVTEDIASRFLLTAAAIGILYKKNASISGAEVGCQGEVGVACSMAAGALTEIMGGSVENVENAAEIGMEHNLGLTCDPVGGLVQVPCIERNAMGAVKAINASRLALRGTGEQKVSLDKVIKTMWDTGNDMKTKYKETARGGLAVNIIEC
jgi:L-serine dehydratase